MSGPCYIGNVRIDVPDTTHLRTDLPWDEWEEAARLEKERKAEASEKAMQAAIDKMHSPARRLAAQLKKNAARRYLKRPSFLDAIWPGLSRRHPDAILAMLDPTLPWGGNPFGARIPDVTFAGARLYARYVRRFEERAETLIAAE